jgi:hypothetical protein
MEFIYSIIAWVIIILLTPVIWVHDELWLGENGCGGFGLVGKYGADHPGIEQLIMNDINAISTSSLIAELRTTRYNTRPLSNKGASFYYNESFSYVGKTLAGNEISGYVLYACKEFVHDHRNITEAESEQAADELENQDGLDWNLYTNTNFGYSIRYPAGVDFTVEPRQLGEIDPNTDRRFFVSSNVDKSIYNIHGGLLQKYFASSDDELLAHYLASEEMEYYVANGIDVTVSTTTFNGLPAILSISDQKYEVQIFDGAGEVFFINAMDYDGSTSTAKGRITSQIIHSFKLLEP